MDRELCFDCMVVVKTNLANSYVFLRFPIVDAALPCLTAQDVFVFLRNLQSLQPADEKSFSYRAGLLRAMLEL